MTCALVPSDLLKQLQSPHVDLPLVGCLAYRAVRFVRVAAIGEAAFTQVGQEFGEASFDCGEVQMVQSEQLYAGAVDEMAFGVQVVQAGVGGGVFSGIEYGGDLACGGKRVGDDGVDEGGFAHAGLADEHAGVALQIRQQRGHIFFGRKLEHAVADLCVGGELCACCGNLRQVAFVQHDDDAQLLVMSGEQAACQQFVVERGLGGDDDDELGDVGRDDFLLEGVGAIQQCGTGHDSFNDGRACPERSRRSAGADDLDGVSAGDIAFLPARDAFEDLAAGQLGQIVTAVGGDDEALKFTHAISVCAV